MLNNTSQSIIDETLNINNSVIDNDTIKLICALDTLSSGKWDNIQSLNLDSNQFGNLGCKYLSKIAFNSLQQLFLRNNRIQAPGILHLSKTSWKHILQIGLSFNPLTSGSGKNFAKADWLSISQLYLYECLMTFPEMLHLLVMQSSRISYICWSGNLGESQEKAKLEMLAQKKMPNSEFQAL